MDVSTVAEAPFAEQKFVSYLPKHFVLKTTLRVAALVQVHPTRTTLMFLVCGDQLA